MTALSLERQLQHARDTAAAFRDRMTERIGDGNAPVYVLAELSALDTIVVIASLGLKAPWPEAKQHALTGIARLVQGWEARGYSAEFVRAVAIEQFDRLEPASAAVN